jgi:hypothetical protein
MAFINEKPDSEAINELSHEQKQDMLRAFATGSTIETIAGVNGLTADEVTAFLNNRTDEIITLKDFYSKVLSPVEDEINEINAKAVADNDKRN